MKKNINYLSIMLLLTVTFSSCSKKDDLIIEEPIIKPTVDFMLASGNKTAAITVAPITKSVTAGIEWSTYVMSVFGATFNGKLAEVKQQQALSETFFTFSNTSKSLKLGSITTEVGAFTESKIQLSLKASKLGNLLIMTGVYTNPSAAKYSITFIFNEDITIAMQLEDHTLKAGGSYKSTATLDWDKLTTGLTTIDFSQADLSGNNTIVIDINNNVALYNKLKANLTAMGHATYD